MVARHPTEALEQFCEQLRLVAGSADAIPSPPVVFYLKYTKAEDALRSCGITVNRNAVPFDKRSPLVTSGLRLGTAAVTTLGMGPSEMRTVAGLIRKVLSTTRAAPIATGRQAGQPGQVGIILDSGVQAEVGGTAAGLLAAYPLYPDLDFFRRPDDFGRSGVSFINRLSSVADSSNASN